MPTKAFHDLLAETLSKTCRLYLQHGASHLLADKPTESDVLQAILNVQSAMEAVSKLHHLRSAGWKAVVDRRHHGDTEAKLIRALHEGNLKTTSYERTKQYLISRRGLPAGDQDLMSNLQNYRNSLVHLGRPRLPAWAREEMVILLARIINTLVWENLVERGPSFFANRVMSVLGMSIWNKLNANPQYIAEAVDLAYENGESVRYCPECQHETWAEVEDTDLLCFCCGYRVVNDAVGFESCPCCRTKGSLIYDALAANAGDPASAGCPKCGLKLIVRLCRDCGHLSTDERQWARPHCPK